MTWSQNEILQHKDFEKMSADEVRAARQEVRRMRLSVNEIPTRRHRSAVSGERPDMRATLRAARRSGSDFIRLMKRRRRTRPRFRWWCCATSRVPWTATRACCSISCTP